MPRLTPGVPRKYNRTAPLKYKTPEEAKEAQKRNARRWHLKNRDRSYAATRAWQARNPEKVRQNNLKWSRAKRAKMTIEERKIIANKRYEEAIRRKYGMGLNDYEQVLKKQNNHCALCFRTPNQERYKRLNWDHDPQTGQVRGLLCTPCNHALGVLGDSPKGLTRALTYVDNIHSTLYNWPFHAQ